MAHPSNDEINQFGEIIIQWSRENPRLLPWKNFSDPYSIWIAEIILQQTRVDQGIPYFEKFIQHFPNLEALAKASLEEVLVQWEGLGYYNRARNLHDTARHIYQVLEGRFPSNSKELLKLKGVGPYTSAAIASFAFNESIGVVDGNVKRVVSRYFNISEPIGLPATQLKVQSLVNRVVEYFPSAIFNQSVMNFGALKCVPGQPDCTSCPANNYCEAYRLNIVDQLPVKKKSSPKQTRWLDFGIYTNNGKIALKQNLFANIWKNLYLFPMVDQYGEFKNELEATTKNPTPDLSLLGKMEWMLTHRRLIIHFYRLNELPKNTSQAGKIIMVDSEKIGNFAIPRPLRLFLNKNSRNLGLNVNNDQ